MRNLALFLTLLLILPAFFPLSAQQMSDEERKRAFLRSRGVVKKEKATPASTPRATTTRPASTPRPTATPVRSARPTPRSTPKPTPRPRTRTRTRTPAPTPTPARSTTPERRATPAATATPRPARTNRATQPPRPSPTPRPRSTSRETIVIEKSGFAEQNLIPPPPQERRGFLFFRSEVKYKYLTPAIRRAIDQAAVPRNRWRYIVVHNSATRQGSAKAFNYYHTKVRKMPNGLAYHFVIGNGTSTGDGQIEIGSRWTRQINGGHVHSDYLNNIALGICFVGDYNRDRPTRQQLEALQELITYVRRRVGKVGGRVSIVKAHKDINPRPTSCPGKRFPYQWMYGTFEGKKK